MLYVIARLKDTAQKLLFSIKVARVVDIKVFFYGLILLYFDNTN